MVLDADALNILSNHRAWLQQLPGGIVMTPHPKEFDRLNGSPCADSYERLSRARSMAEHLKAYILLKGHYTALCLPNGKVVFNTTGNAGMATAGSGDVLSGILTALLARGYGQADACTLGMYLHGLAGDIAAAEVGMESLTASDLIACLPKAFMQLQQ
jgi:NAD(P)H-hydrate epimerase